MFRVEINESVSITDIITPIDLSQLLIQVLLNLAGPVKSLTCRRPSFWTWCRRLVWTCCSSPIWTRFTVPIHRPFNACPPSAVPRNVSTSHVESVRVNVLSSLRNVGRCFQTLRRPVARNDVIGRRELGERELDNLLRLDPVAVEKLKPLQVDDLE